MDGARCWPATYRCQLHAVTSQRASHVRIAAKFDRHNSAKGSQIRSSPTDICDSDKQKKQKKRNNPINNRLLVQIQRLIRW